jgi:hypothetical protein
MPENALPTYTKESAGLGYQVNIRNARYRSEFTTHCRAGVSDYREQLDVMKDYFHDSTYVRSRHNYQ